MSGELSEQIRTKYSSHDGDLTINRGLAYEKTPGDAIWSCVACRLARQSLAVLYGDGGQGGSSDSLGCDQTVGTVAHRFGYSIVSLGNGDYFNGLLGPDKLEVDAMLQDDAHSTIATNDEVKILVLGATGLLGNAVFRSMLNAPGARVVGTIRQESSRALFSDEDAGRLICVGDIENAAELAALFGSIVPDVVVNCIAAGRPAPPDPMRLIQTYSVLPRRLACLCRLFGSRLIQISSDGVFAGHRGAYTEVDVPDADDVYGISKFLGEVDAPHAITLRTSIIGHELQSGSGLLEWFLSQQGECRCFTRAIFSGFPTIVLADMIRDVVIPRPDLCGIYHVATRPISKFDLLLLVAERYGKRIKLVADDRPAPDRSLVADRFERLTGYKPPDWPALVDRMYRDRFSSVGHDVQG